MKKSNLIIEIISALLIFLFVYTATAKLADYSTFRFQLGKSPFIQPIAGLVSWGLPMLELLVSGLLIFRKTKIWGFYGSIFLMSSFTIYIYMMLNYAYYVPCSCGGVLSDLSWEDHLIFNISFLLLALFGTLLESNQNAKSIVFSKP
ncbi:MauE/DoxX family redox-associated membrane protein [Chitinophaga nivalis]|uniref:Methylamine utilisation protein MauE domain-containing protein n=1 Tax=Chitinophaga nivalis TaxID=2991709 RepID=A0ABT3IQE3_9BACT|nr:MauE/DoxX family redox-associated membrane protein [Chitinophaga nivalis]MCW3464115.1 hypothetical protein [Chitinophaga nivalis]MCW3486195.1 hypothetical protein [Chitinophaga nivalis]